MRPHSRCFVLEAFLELGQVGGLVCPLSCDLPTRGDSDLTRETCCSHLQSWGPSFAFLGQPIPFPWEQGPGSTGSIPCFPGSLGASLHPLGAPPSRPDH